ncbi:MAG: hypothetical protein SGARI_005135, partial [Bacillariaceae sp.]
MGTVPAMRHEEYMDHVPMRSIPGIYGENWTQVMDQVQHHLTTSEGMEQLEQMSSNSIQWWNDLQSCMRADMGDILIKIVEDATTTIGKNVGGGVLTKV